MFKTLLSALAIFVLSGVGSAGAETRLTLPAGVSSEIDKAGVIRPALLQKALNAYDAHKNSVRRHDKMMIVDYAQHSSTQRLYVIDLQTGQATAYHVAHGSGSDKDHDGWLDAYDMKPGSGGSPRGAFVGAETYFGKFGKALRLDGLESENQNSRARAIVLHSNQRYVDRAFLETHGKLGRSLGCLVVFKEERDALIAALQDGAFLYIDGKKS